MHYRANEKCYQSDTYIPFLSYADQCGQSRHSECTCHRHGSVKI